MKITHHPVLAPEPEPRASQVATASAWGEEAQAIMAQAHVGVVGLGSVGSVVAEALSRMGVPELTLIDHDVMDERNLDRTLGATQADVLAELKKVEVAARGTWLSHTGEPFRVRPVPLSFLSEQGLAVALDCDILLCCVDRPWPRFVINGLAYSHLIPVVDGGIMARVNEAGKPLHIDWRVHAVGPERPCMVCLGALRRGDAALDREGQLDNPDYIQGLPPEEQARFSRRNVFAFSLSVAAHQVLQAVGVLTEMPRVGATGPQAYHCYPGKMEVLPVTECELNCEFEALTASAADLSPDLP